MTGGKRPGFGLAAGAGLAVVVAAALHFLASGRIIEPPAAGLDPGQPPPAAATGDAPPPPVAGPPPAARAGPEAEEPPLLEIGARDWGWERREGEAVVAGEVRNVSGHKLANLVAEVSFYDAGGTFLTSAEAFIFPTVVEAGRTVRFEVREPWNPAMKDARVSFQELYGYPVKTRWTEP